MKRSTILALMGILITSGGCSGSTDASREGLLVGRIGGQVWRGTAEARVVRDTLYIMSRRENVSSEQWLMIAAAKTVLDTYAVVTGDAATTPSRYDEIVGGDIVVYSAVATAGSIALRESTREPAHLAGTVELTLQGSRGTSRFADGEFDALIREAIP